MLTYQREYLLQLIEQVADEYDPTFVSFAEDDLDNQDNLVCQLGSSPYPVVLCAFLECAKYDAGISIIPFSEVTPPSVEEVEEMLEDYNGKMPSCLTVFSLVKREHDDFFAGWEGIQYSRYFLADQAFKHMSYALVYPACKGILHGKGKLPITESGHVSFEKIKVD